MRNFVLQNPKAALCFSFVVLGVVWAVVDFWNFAGLLAAAASLLACVAVGATIFTLDFSDLKRNWVASACIVLATVSALTSIWVRHPSFEQCGLNAQKTLQKLGQDSSLDPVAYDLDAPQAELATTMYLACAGQRARNDSSLPGHVFQALQEPEASVATRILGGSDMARPDRCLKAYGELRSKKPSLFKPYKDDLSCLDRDRARFSW